MTTPNNANQRHRAYIDFMDIYAIDSGLSQRIVQAWYYKKAGIQVARIEVVPVGRLSLQYHTLVPGDCQVYYTAEEAKRNGERMLAEYLRKKDPASYVAFEESYEDQND